MLLEKAVTKNTYSQQGVSYLIHKHSYWKNIFHGWNMAQYFFHRYIWEVYCNSPILLLFDMFILPLSWCLRKEKKVILLMGILMVAMTVSNRGIASFISKHYIEVFQSIGKKIGIRIANKNIRRLHLKSTKYCIW